MTEYDNAPRPRRVTLQMRNGMRFASTLVATAGNMPAGGLEKKRRCGEATARIGK